MFVHNINPVLAKLGPFEIRYYGIVYAIGVLVVYFTLKKFHKEIKLDKNKVEDVVIYLTLGMLIGARLFEVFVWNPSYYLASPLEIFAVWKGGMSFHGGLLGLVLAGYIVCKKYKINIANILNQNKQKFKRK